MLDKPMFHLLKGLSVVFIGLSIISCNAKTTISKSSEEIKLSEDLQISSSETSIVDKTLNLKIDDSEFNVLWAENQSVLDLRLLVKDELTIEMHKYGDFEQVGELPSPLTSDDISQQANYGDIMLYESNKICIFYGSNTYSYTKLGHIPLREQEITDLLSEEDVTITLFLR